MRLYYVLAALLGLAAGVIAGPTSPPVTIDDRGPALKMKTPTVESPPRKAAGTVCGCSWTHKCVCYASECRCELCAANKKMLESKPVPAVTAPAPFERGSGSTPATTVQPAGAVYTFKPAPVQRAALTYTVAPSMGPFGITSGCANGNCSAPQRFR